MTLYLSILARRSIIWLSSPFIFSSNLQDLSYYLPDYWQTDYYPLKIPAPALYIHDFITFNIFVTRTNNLIWLLSFILISSNFCRICHTSCQTYFVYGNIYLFIDPLSVKIIYACIECLTSSTPDLEWSCKWTVSPAFQSYPRKEFYVLNTWNALKGLWLVNYTQ